jgi:glycosyltransferase involved in cell wall biosynthesis
MNIWIISLFEPTPIDNTRPMRYMGIADAAIKQGHSITQIACTFRHSTKVQRYNHTHSETLSDNYKLVFIHSNSYRKNVSFERMKNHRVFTKNLLSIIHQLDKPEVILVAMPPLHTAEAITLWGKKNGVKVFVDIIDPWPDVAHILVPSWAVPLFKLLVSSMYRQLKRILENVHGVIAISDEYIRWAKSFGYPILKSEAFLPSIAMDDVQRKIQNFLIKHPRQNIEILHCVYAGNLGVAYDIPTILKSAALLHKSFPGRTLFTLAGSGHYEELIKEYALKYSNIKFVGRIGYDELMQLYAHADLGLAQYGKGATQSVTYKFFDYLGAGLPILNSLMSEMAKLTENYKVGFNNQPGDDETLSLNITKFLQTPGLLGDYKKNAIEYARENGNNEVVYKKLVNFITG